MELPVALFAYFGPETVLPLTSVVAAVAGVALMFGRNAARIVVLCVRLLVPGRKAKAPGRPHFARRDRSPTGTPSSGPDPSA